MERDDLEWRSLQSEIPLWARWLSYHTCNVLRFVSTYYCLVFCFMDGSNPNLLYLKRLELQHGHVYSQETKLPRTNEVWSPNRYMRNFISIVIEEWTTVSKDMGALSREMPPMEPEIESWQSEKASVEREIHGSPGQRSDPKKILAIPQMPEPKDIDALKRFLGMVTYLAKFMHHLSEMTEPLRRLDDKNGEFQWFTQHSLATNTTWSRSIWRRHLFFATTMKASQSLSNVMA